MSDNQESQEDFFKETIRLLGQLKDDFQIHGRAMDTTGVSPKLFKEFRIIFKQMVSAGDYLFEVVDYPKLPEQLEEEKKKKAREEANRINPLTENQYVEAIRLKKKGLRLSKIAKHQGINENEYRRRHLDSIKLYEMTQRIIDRVNIPPEGEQDFVLEAQSSNPWGEPRLISQEIQPVRVLLNKGLKLKEVAGKLCLNPDSLKTWYEANKKYFDL